MTKDFWFDEAFTYFLAKNPVPNLLLASASDNNPPFYYIFLHFWMKLGQTEFFLRFPSLVFGTASIFVVYLISNKIVTHKTAVVTSLLTTTSPLFIYYSAETRMYSLWFFLTLILVYLFLKILENPKTRYYLSFTLFYILSLYTHYFTLFITAGLGFFLLLKFRKYKKVLKPFILINFFVFISFLPWMKFFFSQLHAACLCFNAPEGTLITFFSFILGGLGEVTLKTLFKENSLIWRFTLVLSIFTSSWLFLFGLKRNSRKLSPLLPILLLLPVIAVALLSFSFPIFSPRGFFISAFAFYLLVAQGLTHIKNKLLYLISLLFVLMANLTIAVLPFTRSFDHEPMKTVAKLIENKDQSKSFVLHTGLYTYYPFRFYHQERFFEYIITPTDNSLDRFKNVNFLSTDLSDIKRERGKFWLINIINRASSSDILRVQNFFNQNYNLIEKENIGSIEISLYE